MLRKSYPQVGNSWGVRVLIRDISSIWRGLASPFFRECRWVRCTKTGGPYPSFHDTGTQLGQLFGAILIRPRPPHRQRCGHHGALPVIIDGGKKDHLLLIPSLGRKASQEGQKAASCGSSSRISGEFLRERIGRCPVILQVHISGCIVSRWLRHPWTMDVSAFIATRQA